MSTLSGAASLDVWCGSYEAPRVTERPIELTCALTPAAALGTAVLSS